MGFWSSVGSVVSSVGSAISSGISSIGSALSSFSNTIAPVIGSIISAIPAIGKTVANVAQGVLGAFGVLKPDEKIEEVGERALQAAEAGITYEEFDDFDEYLDELRNFDLDPEKSNKRTPAEKIVAGLGVGSAGLEDKLDLNTGDLSSMWLLPMTNSSYFNADKLTSLLTAGQISPDTFNYLDSNLSASQARDLEKKMETGLDAGGMEELYEALEASKSSYEALAEEVNQKLS